MEQKPGTTKVIFLENGPIEVVGTVEISGQYGEKATTQTLHFCRCGHSKNKPYCDGSHRAAGFKG